MNKNILRIAKKTNISDKVSNIDIEVFASSVITECLEVIRAERNSKDLSERSMGLKQARNAIYKHFFEDSEK